MPRINEKTDVPISELNELARRIHAAADKFSESAERLAEYGVISMPLAIDTFRGTTLARLEAFSRTAERELLRLMDDRAKTEAIVEEMKESKSPSQAKPKKPKRKPKPKGN